MARKTVVELIDDISGKPAQETVTFALDGMVYEIDLSAENADRLRSGLAPFLDKARKAGTPRGQRAAVRTDAVTSRTARSREESADIRAWAKQQGIVVNERGRIPAKVIEAYKSGDASAADAAEAVEAVEAAEPKPSVRPVPQATFQAVSNP